MCAITYYPGDTCSHPSTTATSCSRPNTQNVTAVMPTAVHLVSLPCLTSCKTSGAAWLQLTLVWIPTKGDAPEHGRQQHQSTSIVHNGQHAPLSQLGLRHAGNARAQSPQGHSERCQRSCPPEGCQAGQVSTYTCASTHSNSGSNKKTCMPSA